jgi:hypothetical protein
VAVAFSCLVIGDAIVQAVRSWRRIISGVSPLSDAYKRQYSKDTLMTTSVDLFLSKSAKYNPR